MIYVAIGQLAVIALLVYVMLREREQQAKVLADFSKQAEVERRELLNRIAQPGMIVPTSPAAGHRREPRDPKEYSRIGTIQPPKITHGGASPPLADTKPRHV